MRIGDLTISTFFTTGPWYKFLRPRNTMRKTIPFQLIRWLCFCYYYDKRKEFKKNMGLYYKITKITLFPIWAPIAFIMVSFGRDR